MSRYWVRYLLPPGLTCSLCVLQWRYWAGNSWGRWGILTGCSGVELFDNQILKRGRIILCAPGVVTARRASAAGRRRSSGPVRTWPYMMNTVSRGQLEAVKDVLRLVQTAERCFPGNYDSRPSSEGGRGGGGRVTGYQYDYDYDYRDTRCAS